MNLLSLLWILGVAIEAALYLLVRHSSKKYPAFTVYIGLLASSDMVLFYVHHQISEESYFWAWWAQYAITAFALVAVVVEVFLSQFAPLWTIPLGPKALFAIVIAGMGIVAIAAAFYFPANYLASYLRGLRTLGRTVDVFAACSMWMVVLLARYFKMPWNSRSYGVAVGLCVKLTSGSVLAIIRASENHSTVQHLLAPIGMLCALCAEAIWLYFFARYKQPGEVTPATLERAYVKTRLYRNSMTRVLASLKD